MTAAYILIVLLAPHLKLAISGTSLVPSSTLGTTDYSELPFTDPDILGCCVYMRVPGESRLISKFEIICTGRSMYFRLHLYDMTKY